MEKSDIASHMQQMAALIRQHPLKQLFWECTLRCNLSCLHCGSDCRMATDSKDMPLKDFLQVLDSLKPHIVPHNILVNTVGGEPLVRKDISQCGREIRKRGFCWGMVSNGYLLNKEKLDELLYAGLNTIGISLDGLEDTHNWLRDNEKSFSRAIDAIDNLSQQNKKVVWDVITCVNHRNIHQLYDLRDLLISHGVSKWRCTTIFPQGRAANNNDLQLSPSEYKSLMEFIVETRAEGKIALNYSCEAFVGNYEGKVRDYLFGCHAGLTVATILSNGNISGCLSVRSKFDQGNIYTDDFWTVWENRFEVYRNPKWKLKGACKSCPSFLRCLGGGMHLRDDDGNLMICHLNKLKDAGR